MTFQELGLRDDLLRALDDLKFSEPTPIQQRAIPELLPGERDFVGLAQTGTGKTGAFGLPMLECLDTNARHPQGLIICPTRELCLQITNDLQQFSRHMKGVNITAVYGGSSIMDQVRSLKQGSHIVVATPGRLLDLIRRRSVDLSRVVCAVLDEADEMLNMGFQEDIDAILDTLPDSVRVWLFSATMPRGVRQIASNYLHDPVEVTIGTRNDGAANIEHSYCVVEENNRYEALKRILDYTPDIFGLVFCRTRIDTQRVADALMRDGYHAEPLHGDLSQAQRDAVMRKFRNRSVRILVATDVAARGIDVDDITHVIHFMLPDDMLSYTHRSGRTARAGKSGRSIAIINPRESFRIRELEQRCKLKFEVERVPDGKAICRRRLYSFVETLRDMENTHEDIATYLPQACEILETLSKEELIERIISREFGSLLEEYANTRDVNLDPRKTRKTGPNRFDRKVGPKGRYQNGTGPGNPRGGPKGGRAPGQDRLGETSRFFISIGRIDKVNEGAIVRLVCDQAGIPSKLIGAIDMKREFSFFEVQKGIADKVRNTCHGATFDKRQIRVVDANQPPKQATAKFGQKKKKAPRR